MQTKYLRVLFHIGIKGEVGAVKCCPFQGSTSFVDILCFSLSCVCYAFVRVCLCVPCGHLLGKG